MKNYLARNSNFVELGMEPPFFRKIPNFIKFKRFDGFFPNSIPNVSEHRSHYWYILEFSPFMIAQNLFVFKYIEFHLYKIKIITNRLQACTLVFRERACESHTNKLKSSRGKNPENQAYSVSLAVRVPEHKRLLHLVSIFERCCQKKKKGKISGYNPVTVHSSLNKNEIVKYKGETNRSQRKSVYSRKTRSL